MNDQLKQDIADTSDDFFTVEYIYPTSEAGKTINTKCPKRYEPTIHHPVFYKYPASTTNLGVNANFG